MRLGVSLVKPRLSCLHRAAVRVFGSDGSEARASVQPLQGPSSAPPAAAAGAAAASAAAANGSGVPAGEAPHVYRKGARAVFEMPVIKDSIELTEEEAALFKELLDATKQVGALGGGRGVTACGSSGCMWCVCAGG